MFRHLLYDRSALILLDNAADEEQVRDLIPAWPGALVLITSRRSLAGLDGARLHLLARVAGRERVAADPEAADRIVRAGGLLPLAVSLAASRFRWRYHRR